MENSKVKNAAIVATISLAGSLVSGAAVAKPDWAKAGSKLEKCSGVAKKGMNDCGANGHGCAGLAKKDNDKNEWVYTPDGLCKKIGGKVVVPAKKKKK